MEKSTIIVLIYQKIASTKALFRFQKVVYIWQLILLILHFILRKFREGW